MKSMTTYIGTKMIWAVPAEKVLVSGSDKAVIVECDAPDYEYLRELPVISREDGYKVRYADGYESWSPKAVFEEAYLPLVVNPELKTSKPSISQQMVDDFIVNIDVQTMGEKTTVVRATLRNGFEILEASACVSKENYDEKLGAQICLGKIKDKVWMLLGFLLQTAVNGINYKEPVRGPMEGMPFGVALEMAKKGCKIARRNWNGKNQYVFLARGVEFATDADISEYEGQDVTVHDLLVIKTSQDVFQPGWLATQSDMLADDWCIVD